MSYLKNILTAQNSGISKGVCSICTSNRYVIQAALEFGKKHNIHILIESTSNQVNQFGGYTGMNPANFVTFVNKIMKTVGFDESKLILGGDHLGPNPFQNETIEVSMKKAEDMVYEYVKAGYTKIHLDCSMRLKGDSLTEKLKDSVIASRTARLAEVAEKAFEEMKTTNKNLVHPVYVIGSEVPIPGGAQLDHKEIQVTSVCDFKTTVQITKDIFMKSNLQEAWSNVVGVVVQPGVEFGDEHIDFYDHSKAKNLMETIKDYENLTFEGHSTDYQLTSGLKSMVEDGVGILKVGPELTYALREALFALADIENELVPTESQSNFKSILITEMKKNPNNWEKHYSGNIEYKLKYSLLDRSRYYYDQPIVKNAVESLISNIEKVHVPHSLLSQYLPTQYHKVRLNIINNSPQSLICDKIQEVLESYQRATNQD